MYSGNYLKKIIALLAAAALLAGASSCGVSDARFEGKPDAASVIEMARELTSGIKYAITEPISFNKQTKDSGEGGLTLEYLSIYGLKDTAVQDGINELLHDRASALYDDDTPAFKGIEEMPRLSEERSVDVSSDFTWNSNDIISVVTRKTASDEANSIEYLDCVTLSLKDGREMKLGDLFAAGFDYLSIINDTVGQALDEQWLLSDCYGELEKLSAEHLSEAPLVNEDTPFFLSDRGINIILHYDNEDLSFSETKEQAVCVGFDRFGQNWVIAGGCDPELYSDPSGMGYLMTYSGAENYIAEETVRDLGRENVWLLDAVYYPEDMPEELIDEARLMLEETRISDDDALAFARAGDVVWASSNNEIFCSSINGYYIFCKNAADNIRNSGTWATDTVCRVYDGEFREVELRDIFATSWDHTEIFRNKLADSWSMSYGAAGFSLDSGDSGELGADTADGLIEGGSFMLGSRGITFYTESLKISSTDEAAPCTYIKALSVFVPYGEIGLDHFALFGND